MTTPDAYSDSVGEGNEVRRFLGFLRRMPRFWPIVLIAFGVAALAAGAFIYLRHPNYRSEAVLLYTQGVSSADTLEQAQSPRNASVRLKELLFSRSRLTSIVTRFGLYPKTAKTFGTADAVEELKRHVEFHSSGGDTFSIGYIGASAREAREVTSALAAAVIDGDGELRKAQAERARDFLATEREAKNAELKEAEQRLAAFMGEHRRFALDTTPLAAGAAIRASAAGQPATPALSFPAVGASRGPRRATSTGAPSSAAADADERGRAVAALAAANADLAQQQRQYGPAHPDVRRAQGEVERAEARLAALGSAPQPQVAPTRAPDEPKLARASAPVLRPTAPAAAPAPTPATGNTEDVVGLETAWVKLTREVTAARQRVDQVEAALFKAEVRASSEQAGRAVEISVIDPAFLPLRPLGPSLDTLIAMFMAGGLLLGLLGAAFGAALDDRIYDGSSIAPVTPILAQVPKMTWEGPQYAAR